jgi:hypothetical protein
MEMSVSFTLKGPNSEERTSFNSHVHIIALGLHLWKHFKSIV